MTDFAGPIQQRANTQAGWLVDDPVLLAGEIGFEVDTGRLKIGDETSLWSELPYFVSVPVAEIVALTEATEITPTVAEEGGTIVVTGDFAATIVFGNDPLPVGFRFTVNHTGTADLFVSDFTAGDITWIGIDAPNDALPWPVYYFEQVDTDVWLAIALGACFTPAPVSGPGFWDGGSATVQGNDSWDGGNAGVVGNDSWDGGDASGTPPAPELPAPEPEFNVNPGGDTVVVTWPEVDGSTNSKVSVSVDSGDPVVVSNPQDQTAIVVASVDGDHTIEVVVTGPGGKFSPPAGTTVPLVAAPLFEEGSWDPSGLFFPKSDMWFADDTGALLMFERGAVSDVDPTYVEALVEYQLQRVGDGAPVIGDIHEIPQAVVGIDELFPVYRSGTHVYYLAMNQGASPDPTLHLRSYDLSTDTVSDEIALTFQYPGHMWTWDAGHLFMNITDVSGDDIVVEVVNMFDPDNLTMESTTFPSNALSGAIVTEGHLYVTGRDGANEQVAWVVSLPTPVLENTVPWLTDSECKMLALGPSWAVIYLADGRIMNWDLTDPLNPVFESGIFVDPTFPYGRIFGTYQLLGNHAVSLNRIQSGSVGALLGGDRLLLHGDLANPGFNDFGEGAVYAELDVSTPEARANLVLTNAVSDAGWGNVVPQARLGAVQTVGTMLPTDGNPLTAEYRQIFVGSTPAQEPPYDPGPL